MPQALAAAIASYAGISIAAAEVLVTIVITAVAVYTSREAQRRQQNAAKDAYNASLRDRYVMFRSATAPRQIVLGRARVSGPMFFVGSYGTNKEHLTFMVPLAAHEIDAVEAIYFDDSPLVLDGSGNVVGVTLKESFSISSTGGAFTIQNTPKSGTVTAQAVYGTTVVTLGVSVAGTTVTVSGATGAIGLCEIRYQPDPCPYWPNPVRTGFDTITLNGSGNGSKVVGFTPTNVYAVSGTGVNSSDATALTSVAGTTITITGGTPGDTVSITYTYIDTSSKARVRSYLGGAGQVADGPTISNFPGIWTSGHKASGVAYLVVELDYDPTAFPSSIPNVSALVRGAKVLDPRTGVTAWSDNVALLMRHYALSPLGARMTTDQFNDTAAITAANVCDTSSTYVVNGQSYTRALYRGGIAANTQARPQDVLNDLATAMAGKWVFIDGQFRMKAGAYTPPVLTLDETWLTDNSSVHIQPKRARTDVVNVVTATFADEGQAYQVVQMPRVAPTAYITEDGAELPLDITMSAVQFTGQAQHVAGCTLRDARAGITLTVVCNMKAYPLEVFDVVNVTLSRFGWVNKTFEVQDTGWTLEGGIQLTLKETDATVMALGSAFTAFDPARATRLPSPFKIADIAGLSVSSGSTIMVVNPDGTVVQRIRAAWTAITDPGVLGSGGGVEVRYGLAGTGDALWQSVIVGGDKTEAFLLPVQIGNIYLVKVRAFNAIATGNWSTPVLHKVVGVGISIDTPQIVTNAATEVYSSTPGSAVTVTALSHIPDGFSFNTQVMSVTFTPGASGRAQVFVDARGNYTAAGANGGGIWSIQDAGGTYDGWKKGGSAVVPSGTAVSFQISSTRTFAVTGGVAYTLAFYANKLNSGDTFTIDNAELRVEVIKR